MIQNSSAALGPPALRQWRSDPVAFARDVLGVNLWSRQCDIAVAVRDNARVAVRSCHAAGKTFLAATLVLWFLATRKDSLVLTTASTFRQVQHVLWSTIAGIARNARIPIGGAMHQTEYRIADRWHALGLSTDNPERFQGFHAPNLLVVVDEPGAIPEPVFAAVEGVLASGNTRLLMIGNPTTPQGPFYDAFHRDADSYRTFKISAFDTPNLRAARSGNTPDKHLVTPDWVESRKRMWGEDSDLYRSRVLADFPLAGADQLFSLALLDGALSDPSPSSAADQHAQAALGVDVARFGRDATAYSWIVDGRLTRQLQIRGATTMQSAGRIAADLDRTPDLAVAVDDTGVGGGVTDRLREQSWSPLPINFGSSANDAEHYANRAAEIYDRLRKALADGRLTIDADLPTRDELIGQLSVMTYSYTSDGRRAVRKRGRHDHAPSPDLADSFALAWAAYEEAQIGAGVW